MANSSHEGYAGYWLTVTPLHHPNDACGTSSDDLSSDWEPEEGRQVQKESQWNRIRSLVRCTPFFQTYKDLKYRWVQLAGHSGDFKPGNQGTIFKKYNVIEARCFDRLQYDDHLKPFVPEFKGTILDEEENFIELEDLLSGFEDPYIMDIKIGIRTYTEDEFAKATEKPIWRTDMYHKMAMIDENEPSDAEHEMRAVTKLRYMTWRDSISSTSTLGFRIEGIKKTDRCRKDYKTIKSLDDVNAVIEDFTDEFPATGEKYYLRLQALREALNHSEFFRAHEMIGSSLLFVHDEKKANIWMIDFAKTVLTPPGLQITHTDKWSVGNHEDGYLIGITNLLNIFERLVHASPP